MDARTSKNMRDQQFNDRVQHHAAGAYLVGQGREAEWHTFAGIASGLPVQRLVLDPFLNTSIARKSACPTSADYVGEGLAPEKFSRNPAGEFFTHMLNHFPSPRDCLEAELGSLPQLGQARPAAAGTGGGASVTSTRSRGKCSGRVYGPAGCG